MKKRLISVMLVIAMVLSVVPATVFAADSTVDTWADLKSAIEAGGNVTLGANITVDTETITIPDGTSATLNMNGNKITATDSKASGNYELFHIYGELKVTGNGTIELTAEHDRDWNAMSVIFHNHGGVLTIENGVFTHLGGTDMAFVVNNSANYQPDTTANINGGTLTSTYIAVRNYMDKSSTSGKVILNISGGKIEGVSRAV